MRTRLTLKAGEPGTRHLVEEYGDRLLYVRYRYDEERKLRLKTAEIIVDTTPWLPTARPPEGDLLDYVYIRFPKDPTLKTAVKRLGGYWDETAQAWRITRAAASLLDLNPTATSASPHLSTIG